MFLLEVYRKWRANKLYARMGKCGKGVYVGFPNMISRPELLFMDDFTRILNGSKLILTKGRFIVMRGGGISVNLTVVTDNHTPTVGVPYYFTGNLHMNDKSADIVVEEDCWLGANVTLLIGARIGRGAVVAANALVNKKVPPYAVVAGIPAKVIGVKFSFEQVLAHEEALYEPEKRLSEDYLRNLFNTVFKDKKVLGTEGIPEDKLDLYKKKLSEYGYTPDTIKL